MNKPGVSWCVVVAGAEGVVFVVFGVHVRAGGWLLVVGSGDVTRDVIPQIAQGGHRVDPRRPFPPLGVGRISARWGVGHLGLVVAGAAPGGHLLGLGASHKVLPPVDGGHHGAFAKGGQAFSVRGGERGALVSGDVDQAVEE